MIQRYLHATPKQALAALAFVLLALSLLLPLEVYWRAKQGLGIQEGELAIQGIASAVSVRRDGLGIPLIEAQSQDDLFFASGYISAQDRLWQMLLIKMAASGRLSEIFGEKLIGLDIYLRSVGLKRYALRAYQKMGKKDRRILLRFAAGVNAYIKNNKLPIEFVLAGYRPEPWKPEDSMLAFAMANYQLASNLREELTFLKVASEIGPQKAALLFPIYPDEPLPVRQSAKLSGLDFQKLNRSANVSGILEIQSRLAQVLQGNPNADPNTIPASNNWAISGARSKGGKSIVANDTHLAITLPSFWHIMHLKAPGYDAAGVVIPGIPVVCLGFNGKVAWGATMMIADSQDLFLEKLRRQNGVTKYLYKGKWIPVRERTERIYVKGKEEAVNFSLQFTRHGPLLNTALAREDLPQGLKSKSMDSQYGIALRWSMADGERGIRALRQLGQAKDIKEARRALSFIDSMYLNIAYGDANHIGWQTTGRIPLRKKGRGLFPSPGWSGEYDWAGYLPYEKQPYTIDPKEGWLATANHRTVPPGYRPVIGSSWVGPWRIGRIQEILKTLKKADAAAMHKMHADQKSLFALRLKEMFTRSAYSKELSRAIDRLADAERKKAAQRALAMIGQADGVLSRDSASAAIFGALYHSFTLRLFSDEPVFEKNPDLVFALQFAYSPAMDHLLKDRPSPFYDDKKTTDTIESRADLIAQSLADAWLLCKDRLGNNPEDWKWGTLHRYKWQHQISKSVPGLGPFLDLEDAPAGGDTTTLNVSGFTWGKGFSVTWIPALRLVVDFAQSEPAFLVTHAGQSGNPASKHYGDMRPYFLEVRNHPLPFRRDNLDRQYQPALCLLPKGRARQGKNICGY